MPTDRNPWCPRLATSLAMLAGLVLLPELTRGQDPAPARKDTGVRLQPKEVTLSSSVSPALAKPGDEVTYTVTVKVESPWHIYAYAEEHPEDGPRATQFDLFNLSGLEATGTWTAQPEPHARPEPAFDNKVFSFHEEEVAWSRKLRVPADAKPGERKIQSQISFQICTDQTCKPPTRITVPAAILTVVGEPEGGGAVMPTDAFASQQPGSREVDGRRGTSSSVALGDRPDGTVPTAKGEGSRRGGRSGGPSSGGGGGPSAAAAPSLPSSRYDDVPREVSFEATVDPDMAPPGSTVEFKLTAKVEKPWRIFAMGEPSDGGPAPTQIEIFARADLEFAGEWKASPPPVLRAEPAFGGKEVLSHEGEVTWSIPVRIPEDGLPVLRELVSQISFQIASDEGSKPLARVTLDPAALSVTPPKTDVAGSESLSSGSEGPGGVAESKINQGLLSFLLWSALGGVAALVMPCTWPMIPITVNFFVKQGQTRQGGTLGLAITYSLAIVGIYTLVGVAFSALFGAASLTSLANNVWLNLGVGLLFLAFGLSLLGLFEFRLPSFLLNASAQGESRGGLIGVMFMALTLTVTSFTCTFPVVGALLVMASRGSYLYPIVGLATFATVLALPFFGLAAAPGMLSKLPRSGDWMNAVKVVGGLVEIGAAFKFLNTAEVSYWGSPEQAWIDSRVMLSAWVVIAVVCGLYLIGLFRTDHDHDTPRVGPIRLVSGVLFLTVALYLSPALFGYPPRGLVYERLILGLLSADSDTMDFERQIGLKLQKLRAAGTSLTEGGPSDAGPRKATSSDPEIAQREERTYHGVSWGLSYGAALDEARKTSRPILIDFTGVNCANCRLMEKRVLPLEPVVEQLQKFITVQLYTDRVPIGSLTPLQKEELAEANRELEIELTNQQVMPLYVILDPSGKLVAMEGGYIEPDRFIRFLEEAYRKATAVGGETATALR